MRLEIICIYSKLSWDKIYWLNQLLPVAQSRVCHLALCRAKHITLIPGKLVKKKSGDDAKPCCRCDRHREDADADAEGIGQLWRCHASKIMWKIAYLHLINQFVLLRILPCFKIHVGSSHSNYLLRVLPVSITVLNITIIIRYGK